MTGELYIDSLDAHTHYGVSLEKDAFAGIVEYPPLKSVDTCDWHEYDGIEADLSSPKLDTRSLTIAFICLETELTGAMIEQLSDGAYHTFLFSKLSLTLSLRLTSQKSRKSLKRLQLFSLEFSDDFPLSGYTYVAPTIVGVSDGFEIDGVDLSVYGIRVLYGTLDEIKTSPDVKENLLVNLNGSSGATYDGETVTYKSKEVKLSLLMRTDNITDFWSAYRAFLYDLIRPNERQLFVDDTSETYPCYYKDSSAVKMVILPSGRVWCEFDVTMIFTSFRVEAVDFLLSSEAGELIQTQDEINYINVQKDVN